MDTRVKPAHDECLELKFLFDIIGERVGYIEQSFPPSHVMRGLDPRIQL